MEVQPKSPTAKGPAEWFTGDVWIDAVAQAHGPSPISIVAADLGREGAQPGELLVGEEPRRHQCLHQDPATTGQIQPRPGVWAPVRFKGNVGLALFFRRELPRGHGTRQALLNHTDRMLQPEREYAGRFPERTRADALRTRKGSRLRAAGRPWRNVEASLVPMRYRRRIVPVGNRPDASAFWDRSKS